MSATCNCRPAWQASPLFATSVADTMYLMTYVDEVTGKIVYTLKVRKQQDEAPFVLSVGNSRTWLSPAHRSWALTARPP